MKSFLSALVGASLMAILLCLPPAVAAEEALFQVVEVEGSAVVAGSDRARARSEAVRDALQKAVGQVAGQWLSPQEMAKPSPLLKGRLFSRAEEFIQDFRIVTELGVDVYTVTVRATVLAAVIRKELAGLGLLKPLTANGSLNTLSLTIREIADYRSYVRCREVLKEQIAGIREVIPREVSWGMARFELTTTDKMANVVEQLQEKLPMEIGHQDERTLEFSLK